MKNLEYSSKSQAENGTDNTTIMTPLRVKQSIAANAKGGGTGTTDYTQLTNKPKINNVELNGNKTAQDLGISGNVQADWNVTDPTNGAYINNKPTIPTKTSDLTNDSNFVSDSNYTHTDNNYTTTEKDKLAGIASGAEQNVQSDWNQTNTNADDYIKNKPTIPTVPTNTSNLTNDGDGTQVLSPTSVSPTMVPMVFPITNNSGNGLYKQDIFGDKTRFQPVFEGSVLRTEYIAYQSDIPYNTSELNNDSGFITSETDPVFSASPAGTITTGDINDWNAKQDELVSGNNIKTINNQSLLGSGNINIQTGATYYFDGQNNQANLDMLNAICAAFDSGAEINLTGKFADYATGQIFQAPINVTKYTDTNFNEIYSFVSDPVAWLDYSTNPETLYYFTFALSLTGTWGHFTDVSTYLLDIMTPEEWAAKQDTLVSGTNIKTINGNSLLGSGNLVIGGGGGQGLRGCVVGQGGNATGNPYYKFASISFGGAWNDRTITFKVHQGYGDGNIFLGILTAHVRTNGSNVVDSAQLSWEYANSGVDENLFTICYKSVSGGTTSVELYAKCSVAYTCYHFDVISESDRTSRLSEAWTLYTNVANNGGASSLPSAYTSVASTLNTIINNILASMVSADKVKATNGFYSTDTGNVGTQSVTGSLVVKIANSSEAPNNGVVLEYSAYSGWGGQLYIGDNANQGVYYNGWYNGTRGSWRKLAWEPVSLYDNSTGTNGNVTLSETSANFSYIDIQFRSSEGADYVGCQRVYNPNGKYASLMYAYAGNDNGTVYFKMRNIYINGNSITTVATNRYSEVKLTSSTSASKVNQIYITKVMGFR